MINQISKTSPLSSHFRSIVVLDCFEVVLLLWSLNRPLKLEFHVIRLFHWIWVLCHMTEIASSHLITINCWLLDSNDMTCLIIQDQLLILMVDIWFKVSIIVRGMFVFRRCGTCIFCEDTFHFRKDFSPWYIDVRNPWLLLWVFSPYLFAVVWGHVLWVFWRGLPALRFSIVKVSFFRFLWFMLLRYDIFNLLLILLSIWNLLCHLLCNLLSPKNLVEDVRLLVRLLFIA